MANLWQSVRQIFRRQVQVDTGAMTVAMLEHWEPVESTCGPVWRHRSCGDLVRGDSIDQHMREQHDKRVAIQMRFYEDGGADIAGINGYILTPQQKSAMHEFDLMQMRATLERFEECRRKVLRETDKVIPFPVPTSHGVN